MAESKSASIVFTKNGLLAANAQATADYAQDKLYNENLLLGTDTTATMSVEPPADSNILTSSQQNDLVTWINGYLKFLNYNTRDTGSLAINSLGLVGGSFVTDDPNTAYQPPTATSSEAQLLVIRGCLDCYKLTGNKQWLSFATLTTNALLKYFYLTPIIPDEPDKKWVPHWLVNVTAPFHARSFELDGRATFTSGVATFKHDGLVRVYSARALDATLEVDWAPTAEVVGKEYKIKSLDFNYSLGSVKITLEDSTFNGDLLLAYGFSTDEMVAVGERCEAWPVWRSLKAGECGCATDSLAWAISIYQTWYEITGDNKWNRALASTKAAFVEECDVSNSIYYLHLKPGQTDVLTNGVTAYSSRSSSATYSNQDNLIMIKYPESTKAGEESFGAWVGDKVDFTDSKYINVVAGSDSLMHVFVKIDEEKEYVENKRWTCDFWLKGTGITADKLESINLKPENFYHSYQVWWGTGYNHEATIADNSGSGSSTSLNNQYDTIDGIYRPYQRIAFSKGTGSWAQAIIGGSYGQTLPFSIKYKTSNNFDVVITTSSGQHRYSLPSSGKWTTKEVTLESLGLSSIETISSIALDAKDDGNSSISISYIGELEKMPNNYFTTLSFGYSELPAATVAIKYIWPYPQREPLPYAPYIIPFDYHLENYEVSDQRGAIYIGYQAPWVFQLDDVFPDKATALQTNLKFLSDSQDYAVNSMGVDGFFANVFFWDYREDYSGHTPNTFSMSGPWGDVWGGFQYRAIADTARVFLSDPSNSMAHKIVTRFYKGLDSIWNGTISTFPTVFNEKTKPYNNQHDPQMVANLAKSLAYSSKSTVMTSDEKTLIAKLLRECYNTLNSMYVPVKGFSDSLVEGTFSPDPANNNWYEYWGGDILSSLVEVMNISRSIYPLYQLISDSLSGLKYMEIGQQYTLSLYWNFKYSDLETTSGQLFPTFNATPFNSFTPISVDNHQVGGELISTVTATEDFVTSVASGLSIAANNLKGKLIITKCKLEKGATATPWMPANSELTTLYHDYHGVTLNDDGLVAKAGNTSVILNSDNGFVISRNGQNVFHAYTNGNLEVTGNIVGATINGSTLTSTFDRVEQEIDSYFRPWTFSSGSMSMNNGFLSSATYGKVYHVSEGKYTDQKYIIGTLSPGYLKLTSATDNTFKNQNGRFYVDSQYIWLGNPGTDEVTFTANAETGKVTIDSLHVATLEADQTVKSSSSLLSRKTNVKKLSLDKALKKINQTEIYDWQFKKDVKSGSKKIYSSYIIDDLNSTPNYSVADEFLSEDQKGRDDGTLLAYAVAAIQLLDQRLKEVEKCKK